MRNERGFTLVELLVAMAVSTIVIGGTYSTYTLVSNQYEKIKETGEIHYSANQVMQIVSRDIRMAGYTNRDFNSAYTKIPRSDAVSIEDNGDTCCDALNVQYDREINGKVKRVWTRYFTKNERGRNRLYKTEKIKQGNSWVSLHNPTDQLLVDRVTNFQLDDNVGDNHIYWIGNSLVLHKIDADTGKLVKRFDGSGGSDSYRGRHITNALAYGDGHIYWIGNSLVLHKIDADTGKLVKRFDGSGGSDYYRGRHITNALVHQSPQALSPSFIELTLSLHSKKKYKNKYRQAELSTSVTARNLALVEQ